MIPKQRVLKISALALIASFVGMISCKEDEPQRLTLQDTADITEEAVTESYFQDLDDMAGIAIEAPSEPEYSGGRTSTTVTISDNRFQCDGIVVTIQPDAGSTADVPKGVLTVDFGTTGCTDLKGNVRKGKLIFTYQGKRFMPGSTLVTTTENYFINDVKLEGTRTLTNVQQSDSVAPRFNVVLSNGKATFADGSFATRESDITYQWNRADNPLNDNLQFFSASTASGLTRFGRTYSVTLLQDLIFKRHCGIAVSGIKKYTLDGEKEVTIDYGDGTCDRSFTITINGVSRTINL
ncbi:MAG TPA: hypothetical protein VF490_12575 [Chryseosolibacter sp.]